MGPEPQPRWYAQLLWSKAEPITPISKWPAAPESPGLYAFTTNTKKLSKLNCLYLGKADGPGTSLRSRLASYRQKLGKSFLPSGTHAGTFMLHQYVTGQLPLPAYAPLYLRWTVVAVARELEGRLIEMFDPTFNFDFPEPVYQDYELIAPHHLLRPKPGRR